MRAAITLLCCYLLLIPTALGNQPPNIVLIIADDMGWKDVGYNGSEIRTPNIDQLAASGARLDRYYSQPSCTPTRASLMTGQAAVRTGLVRPIMQTSDAHLPLQLKILPQYLQEAGYETALVGKWHLGHANKTTLPMARGFDHAYGYLTGGIGYYDHTSGHRYDWHRNQVTLREEGYATHLIANESVRRIRERDPSKPLFLYTAFSAPHLPNEDPAETIAKYASINDPHRRVHAAMVDELDQGIGQILDALDAEDIRDNTLVWFMSDNGGAGARYSRGALSSVAQLIEQYFGEPAPTSMLEFIRENYMDGGSDNGRYPGGKGSVHEGGILVPSVIAWPDSIPARSIPERITVQDVLPTLAAIAGAKVDSKQVVDGADHSGFLMGLAPHQSVDFIVESAGASAYFSESWKFIRDQDGNTKLFDINKDPYENNDLSNNYPSESAVLQGRLNGFPRGDVVNISMLWFFLDPEAHGGEETRQPPWADLVNHAER